MGLSFWKRISNTAQIRNDYSEKPAGLKWRSNTIFILVTVGVGLFTDLFLYGLIVPVLPFMLLDRVGLPESQIQSHTSGLLAAYAGASVVFSPIAGVLADKVSTRQAPFLLGLSALLGATILLFVGKTVPVLVVARVLQGMSSGMVWTLGLTLCIETVGPENMGKTTGTLFSFISVGTLWAPTVGGLLYNKAGYVGVLGLSLAVLAVDFIMRAFMIEKKVASRYDAKDANISNDAINGPTTNRDEDQNDEYSNAEQQPLLPRAEQDEEEYKLSKDQSSLAQAISILPCLSNASLLTALWLALVQATLLGSCDATITTVSRELFGFDSLKAGLLFLPLGLLDLVVSPLAGWATDRYGTKPVAVISYVYLVPILVLLRLPQPGGLHQVLLYAGLLALLGIGISGTGAPSIVEAGAVVEKYHKNNKDFFGTNGPYAQLYGLNSMMFNAGLTLGPELS
ncbi:hypothetical protein LTR37_007423 [Vermiconidia calcicola]|uniref:Uncharacterized protein n=1 Tax=Vermiconidia calcicola TaxID=1690605 RepID=A0ACC3NDS1_9PEZI|nr:hypothetical protein LTR37_007423 [Vermiconidia calcicola]